jgi:hypothetical protein
MQGCQNPQNRGYFVLGYSEYQETLDSRHQPVVFGIVNKNGATRLARSALVALVRGSPQTSGPQMVGKPEVMR